MSGPTDYAKIQKPQFRVGDLDLPQKRGITGVGRRKMHRCALVEKQKRVELTLWENMNTTRNGTCWKR